MPRLLLSALAVYSIGCIVPTPLEAEQPGPNHVPRIIKATEPVDFTVGVYTVPTAGMPSSFTPFSFNVFASDEDVGDTLTAYLAYINGGQLSFDSSVPLTATADNLTVRSGDFATKDWCTHLNLRRDQPYQFYVYVVDKPLPGADLSQLTPASAAFKDHYDDKYWVITCP